MIYLFLWKMLIMEKNKKLIFHLQINAEDAMDLVRNLDLNLFHVPLCGGHGQVRSSQGFFTIQQTCPECAGSGEQISSPCKECRGIGKNKLKKRYLQIFQRGVDDGTRIRLSGKGEAGIKGGGNGDLYIFVSVKSHSIFKRSEENLFLNFLFL